jgi:hypothetical protein
MGPISTLYSQTQAADVKERVQRIRAREVQNFATQKFQDTELIDEASDDPRVDEVAGVVGAHTKWLEVHRHKGSELWSVVEKNVLPDTDDGLEVQTHPLHTGICFFDALHLCASFEEREKSFIARQITGPVLNLPHYADAAAREHIVFDTKTHMPVPLCDGSVLVPANIHADDMHHIEQSAGNMLERHEVGGVALEDIFDRPRVPVTASTDELTSGALTTISNRRELQNLDKNAEKFMSVVEAQTKRQGAKLNALTRAKNESVASNHASLTFYRPRSTLAVSATMMAGVFALAAVPMIVTPSFLFAALSCFWGSQLYRAHAKAKSLDLDTFYTAIERPRARFNRRARALRKDIKGAKMSSEETKKAQLSQIDILEVSHAALCARSSFNRAAAAKNKLSQWVADRRLQRDLKQLKQVSARLEFNEAITKSLLHAIQNTPPVYTDCKDIDLEDPFSEQLRFDMGQAGMAIWTLGQENEKIHLKYLYKVRKNAVSRPQEISYIDADKQGSVTPPTCDTPPPPKGGK